MFLVRGQKSGNVLVEIQQQKSPCGKYRAAGKQDIELPGVITEMIEYFQERLNHDLRSIEGYP